MEQISEIKPTVQQADDSKTRDLGKASAYNCRYI